MAYDSNIQVAGLTLAINPEQYAQQFIKLGEYIRTVGGGIIDMDMNGYRLETQVSGLTVTQVEDLKRRFALRASTGARAIVDFIDFIPIAEVSPSRSVYEDLGSSTVEGQTVYLYVPQYSIYIADFIPRYEGGIINFVMAINEI